MAYQLQPGMKVVQDHAIPSVCATEEVLVYPQPSTLNYVSSRPNTMLYGTAPYMAGKGSPAQYINTSDELRPCLLYTSPSPRDGLLSRMPASA